MLNAARLSTLNSGLSTLNFPCRPLTLPSSARSSIPSACSKWRGCSTFPCRRRRPAFPRGDARRSARRGLARGADCRAVRQREDDDRAADVRRRRLLPEAVAAGPGRDRRAGRASDQGDHRVVHRRGVQFAAELGEAVPGPQQRRAVSLRPRPALARCGPLGGADCLGGTGSASRCGGWGCHKQNTGRASASTPATVAFDEFTSVVDRNVARSSPRRRRRPCGAGGLRGGSSPSPAITT